MNKTTDMQNWLSDAVKGDSFVYFSGLLARDREACELNKTSGTPEKTKAADDANEIGNLAWRLHELGSVALTQRRRGHLLFDYIAQKR